ncbi:MAG: YidC/Oxa1 family membrane protein insertase [Kiritimatiellales bacterium]|nr:YidC/Oxa1 family membrane protein insertase [Kiritimatiellales bacterium]
MSAKPKSKLRDFFEFFILFLALYFLTQLALKQFFPDTFSKDGNGNGATGVVLSMQDATVKGDHHPVMIIKNHTEETLKFDDSCPKPPVIVVRVAESGEEEALITMEENAVPCVPLTEIESGGKVTYELSPWKYSLFSEYGTYRLMLPISSDVQESSPVVEFSISEAGPITQMFRAFISKPLLNLLILIASFMPGYNLGLAIIILTVLVKLVLFIPTQKGLEGQRRMQAVQPKLEEIKKKHKEDPKRMQEETMKVWKEHNVNPMQSCLPILVQMPVLIGLFFVIRDGSILELSQHLIYGPYQDLSWTWGTNFLGLNLTEPNIYVMPLLLVVLQFSQMKLSFAIAKKKKESKETKESKESKAGKKDPQAMQQKVMMYGLPLMIGFFALKFPAAVSLYWAVSTLFAVGQQLVVNRKELK